MLEANYEGRNPWPIAADGAGHSLVLAKPSYGENDPRAWAASESIDGSPGRDDNFVTDALSPVVINEILAHTEPSLGGVEDYLELYNHGNTTVDLSGAWLSDKGDTNKYRIPDGTTLGPRGFKAFTESTLGFALSADGGRVFLVNSNQNRVIDCVDYAAQANGVSLGRYPDGADAFYPMANRTPEAANGAYSPSPVVLNELMYSPISGDNNDEYIELYNRTSNPVDVGYWRFTSGVTLTLPTNTVIPAHGYLVVAKNATNLFAHYANLNSGNTVGNYGGSLANSGERVALSRPDAWATVDTNGVPVTNIIYVVMNEVTYGDGGRWGTWADGGGSSLELVDPESDTRQAANWADSDETAKSQWTSFEFSGPTGETFRFNGDRLLVFLLGVGECLVDELEVHVAGGTNLVLNSGFEQGLTGWTLHGSHDFSTVEDGGFAGAKSLHLRASSRGDNGPNKIQTALTPAATGNVTLRGKARWLRGWPEILLRLHGGGAEVTGHLNLPTNLGTPGAPNSRAVPNAGPAIYNVSHSPALPQAGETVVVTCRATDPNGIGSLMLRYRLENGATAVTPAMFTGRLMLDNGTFGDAIAADGIYSATLPGQPVSGSISFYIEAVDSLGATNRFPQDVFPAPGLPRCFPNDAIARECVVRWGETMMPGSFATYHLWLTYANSNRWANRLPHLNNAQIDGTFAYNNSRVVYNSLPLYAGSPWHQGAMTTGPSGANRVDFVQNFPSDDRLLGNTDFVLNNPGNPGGTDSSDYSAQTEQTSYMIFNEIGLVYNHRRYVHHFVNGSQR
ncbi:MAG TPA: lamin tail domain-containing protein, partial [Candidatus Saccharimonadales bacterium]|nr:lamin tail domain-containing protein [Candidatus Saccharimonadales bacterium]